MNKVLLEYSHNYVLFLAAFSTTVAELSGSNEDHIVHKLSGIYYLAICRKTLSTMVLLNHRGSMNSYPNSLKADLWL